MPVQWLEQYGEAAGYISTILGLMALILVKPIMHWVRKRREEKEKAHKDVLDFRKEMRDALAKIDAAMAGVSDDIGDLQYERLSQAQDFYVARGWCPGSKKEMLCRMHQSYRAKGRNHLSEHYEEEILRLADKPEKEEDA